MIWLVGLIGTLLVVGVLDVVLKEEAQQRRQQPPMGWLRRLLSRNPADRRRFERYRASFPLTYRVLPSGHSASGESRDVSLGGVGLMLYEKLPAGTSLEITVRREASSKALTVQGTVRWVRELPPQPGDPKRAFWAGIEITRAGPSLERLRELLRQVVPTSAPTHG